MKKSFLIVTTVFICLAIALVSSAQTAPKCLIYVTKADAIEIKWKMEKGLTYNIVTKNGLTYKDVRSGLAIEFPDGMPDLVDRYALCVFNGRQEINESVCTEKMQKPGGVIILK